MPFIKRKKSGISEQGSGERFGIRMTTDPIANNGEVNTIKSNRFEDGGGASYQRDIDIKWRDGQPTSGRADAAVSRSSTVTRSCTGAIKRQRRDSSPPLSPVKKEAKLDKSGTPDAKGKRQVEQSSCQEKNSRSDGYECDKAHSEPDAIDKDEVATTAESKDAASALEADGSVPRTYTGQGLYSTRSTTGSIKRQRKESSPPTSPVKREGKAEKTATPEAKTKRQWEQWSNFDKNSFFEGLYEFGKDFDAIHNVITQKHKRKGAAVSEQKNKDQVRHFYYRTWHSISKVITTSLDVKKSTQELYGLINYGELRKRIWCKGTEEKMVAKLCVKLNELIQNGVTVVKVRGKNVRIKTPVCNALKKINNITVIKKKESPCLPETVTLELSPKGNQAWAHVQAMSHNPRLRIALKPERRLSSVLVFLEKKWKSHRQKLKEGMGGEVESTRHLRLYPHNDCSMVPVSMSVKKPKPRPKLALTLSSYKENVLGLSPTGKHDAPSFMGSLEVLSGHSNSHPSDPEGATYELPKADNLKEPVIKSHSLHNHVSMDDNAMFPDDLNMVLHTEQSSENVDTEKNNAEENICTEEINSEAACTDDAAFGACRPCSDNVEAAAHSSEEDNDGSSTSCPGQQIWGLDCGDDITIAELYLMCGSRGTVKLEYGWHEDMTPIQERLVKSVANMLQRLVHLATLEFADSKSKGSNSAPCQACGSRLRSPPSNKNITNARNPVAAVEKFKPSVQVPRRDMTTQTMVIEQDINIITNSDDVFRVPIGRPHPQNRILGTKPGVALTQKYQFLQKMNRSRKQTSRLVQRTLLPKMQTPAQQVVTLAMVPSTSDTPGSLVPVITGRPENPTSIVPVLTGQQILSQPRMVQRRQLLPEELKGFGQSGSVGSTLQTLSSNFHEGLTPIHPNTAPGTVLPSISGYFSTSAASASAIVTMPMQTFLQSVPNSGGTHVLSNTTVSNVDSTSILSMAMQASGVSLSLSTMNSSNSSTMILSSAGSPTRLLNSTLPPSSETDSYLSKADMESSKTSDSSLNLSTLLDISLPSVMGGSDTTDKLLDFALGNSNSNFSVSALLDNCNNGDVNTATLPGGDTSTRLSPPTSLSRLFKISDPQWNNGESIDISFGSLLDDSPLKKSSGLSVTTTSSSTLPLHNLFYESSRDSILVTKLDVDSTLQCMMNENSLDYASNFADLAAQITAQTEVNRDRPSAAITET